MHFIPILRKIKGMENCEYPGPNPTHYFEILMSLEFVASKAILKKHLCGVNFAIIIINYY